jgi:hypothetical protein
MTGRRLTHALPLLCAPGRFANPRPLPRDPPVASATLHPHDPPVASSHGSTEP